MKRQINLSAIVPCYNEDSRLINVIQTLQSAKLVDEIILVDDGSNKETKDLISQLSGIKILTHSHNLGKTAAMYTGFTHSVGKHIFFLDADLRGLTNQHVDDMINSYLDNQPMMLLSKRKDIWSSQVIGLDLILTGERIISRDFLEHHPQIFQSQGYLVEVIINKFTFGKLPVYYYDLREVEQKYKIFKRGPIGLWCDLVMHSKIILFLGLRQYLWQSWFARTHIPQIDVLS